MLLSSFNSFSCFYYIFYQRNPTSHIKLAFLLVQIMTLRASIMTMAIDHHSLPYLTLIPNPIKAVSLYPNHVHFPFSDRINKY